MLPYEMVRCVHRISRSLETNMRHFVCFAIAALSAFGASPTPTQNAPVDAAARSVLNRMPLRFEAASSQAWTARSLGFGVGVNRNGAVFGLGQELLELQFVGGNGNAPFVGEQKSQTPSVYLGPNGREASAFLRLRRENVYPGIDVVYYGEGQTLEYDFDLAPGADPSKIRMKFSGADSVRLDNEGSVILSLRSGDVVQKAPVTYQRKGDGQIMTVESRYVPENDGSYSLQLGAYDSSKALTVDPQLLFTAYLAGTGADSPVSMTRDRNGSIYIVGLTSSRDFPLVGTAYSGFLETPNPHIFTTKLNPLAARADDVIPYSGFFGGQFGDTVKAATVDANGVLYITGITDDFFFPVTSNAFKSTNDETRKMFVVQLDTKIAYKDSLTYSTFFGGKGNEEPTGIALGPKAGQVFITGFTSGDDYPTKNPIQEKRAFNIDGFVAEFDLTKSGADSLVNSTYLGGSFNDIPLSIAADSAGKVYLTGYTFSYDFPTTANGYQTNYNGGSDAFLTRLDLTKKVVEYGTFLGGSTIDRAYKVMLDSQGRVAVAGFTLSDNFPVTANAIQRVNAGNVDAFLTVFNLNAASPLQYSTFYGGSDGDVFMDMRVGPNGYYYLGGYTLSRDLKTVDALRPTSALGSTDGLVVVIDPNEVPARGLIYASYVTGAGYQMVNQIEVDTAGNVYVTGVSLGNVFAAGQAVPPEDSSTNVFILVFKPSAPAVLRENTTVVRESRSR